MPLVIQTQCSCHHLLVTSQTRRCDLSYFGQVTGAPVSLSSWSLKACQKKQNCRPLASCASASSRSIWLRVNCANTGSGFGCLASRFACCPSFWKNRDKSSRARKCATSCGIPTPLWIMSAALIARSGSCAPCWATPRRVRDTSKRFPAWDTGSSPRWRKSPRPSNLL